MTILNEGRYPAEFVLSEANKTRSRSVARLVGGQGVVQPGSVIAQIASNGQGSSSAVKAGSANTGNGTLGTLSALAAAMLGVYQVRFTTASAYTVTDPRGRVVGAGVNGTPFPGGQILFTTTAGGTPFIAGDGFDVTVTAVPLSFVVSTDTGSNGSQTAVAVALYGGDTIDGPLDVSTIVRDAEVMGPSLVYHPSVNDAPKRATKATQLAAVGIIVR
jgi:hypothetical protein